jgi:hypothetical protein
LFEDLWQTKRKLENFEIFFCSRFENRSLREFMSGNLITKDVYEASRKERIMKLLPCNENIKKLCSENCSEEKNIYYRLLDLCFIKHLTKRVVFIA